MRQGQPGRHGVAAEAFDQLGMARGDVGEVYVVGVHPELHGRGLAGPLTRLGLAHLARRGVVDVELYVEGDNEPAKATYVRRGFVRAAHDVMYVHTPARAM